MFTANTYIDRRAQLRTSMKSGIILFPANHEASSNYAANTYPFRQDSNFLYFFGLNEPNYVGVIDIESGRDWLFADDLTMDDIIWMGYLPSVKDIAALSGVENTAPLSQLNEVIQKAIRQGRPIHYVNPYRSQVALQLMKLFDTTFEALKVGQSVDLIQAIVKQRSIKSHEEIIEIEKAGLVAHQMHTAAMRMCRPGIYEYQIAGAMEGITLAHNGGVSFPIILSMNGQTLHNHDHSQMLKEGRLVVADAGAETAMNYCSDITRTTPVGGKFNQRQKEIYEIVLKANMDSIASLKPNIPYRDIHLQACTIIGEGLKALGIMKGDISAAVQQGAHAIFMPHGLGHMMGLDVHDMENMGENLFGYDQEIQRSEQFGLAYLRLGRRLQTGFVLTVEPGIYFIPALIDMWKSQGKFTDFINYEKLETYKDFGGIRIEDDVLITTEGAKVLGPHIPKGVQELEDFCAE
ncbi:MAG: aminopeptidase P family protein [Bacteroidales bacterium]